MITKEIKQYDIENLSVFNEKDILVSRFAPYLAQHKNLHLAHKHSFYHLLIFTKGGGTHEIDFNSFQVAPGHIYFMIPGQVHSWSFEGDVDGYVVNFSEMFFRSYLLRDDYLEKFRFFRGNVQDSVLQIPETELAGIMDIFRRLIAESDQPRDMGLDMVRSLLLQLFYSVSRLLPLSENDPQKSPKSSVLLNFKKQLDTHYRSKRLPSLYAEKLFVTPNYLNALCKEFMGISAGEVIRNRIILEAKRQLVNLDVRISEIALNLNFEDSSNFTKFFKKHVGSAPDEFRKSMLLELERKREALT